MSYSKTIGRLLVYLSIVPAVLIIFYLFSVCLMSVGVYRLTAMSIGAIVSPLLAWMVFPLVFWRPITMRIVLIAFGCVLLGYGVVVVFIYLDIGLPRKLSGPYGLFNLLIYSIFPAVFFEWIARCRPGWVIPRKAL